MLRAPGASGALKSHSLNEFHHTMDAAVATRSPQFGARNHHSRVSGYRTGRRGDYPDPARAADRPYMEGYENGLDDALVEACARYRVRRYEPGAAS